MEVLRVVRTPLGMSMLPAAGFSKVGGAARFRVQFVAGVVQQEPPDAPLPVGGVIETVVKGVHPQFRGSQARVEETGVPVEFDLQVGSQSLRQSGWRCSGHVPGDVEPYLS